MAARPVNQHHQILFKEVTQKGRKLAESLAENVEWQMTRKMTSN
jgi:hypothetical protein